MNTLIFLAYAGFLLLALVWRLSPAGQRTMRQADNAAAIGHACAERELDEDQARAAMRDAAISYFADEGLEYTEGDITGYVNEAYFEYGHDIGEI